MSFGYIRFTYRYQPLYQSYLRHKPEAIGITLDEHG